jgi:DNA helicase-2/ATP-dependent DNA helicase PcrA
MNREKYHAIWEKAYNELNEAQKQAVNQTEGAIMAIAGPGTGKTQLLAVRIGKILNDTHADPHNILCLTYTDAGAVAMRQRLASFIGPEAYNVNIHTFHAFCNAIIRENGQYFGNYRDLQLLSEIEEIEVFRTLLDALPDEHIIKRLKGDIYYEGSRLKNLFNTMKQEGWTPAFIEEQYQQYCALLQDPATAGEKFLFKRKSTDKNTGITYQPGDLNPRLVKEELARFESLVPAARLLDEYNALLAGRQRFDYQDMILWVIEKFRQHDDLLAKYQERFQYILVDEYQDTNGAQNTLLFLLADYWEDPNVFIVGDDDQSIFRFQGANMNSILEFKEKFQPLEIVLTENYRSSQVILDQSRKLIENNQERLANRYTHLMKVLVEKRFDKPTESPEPQLHSFENSSQEEAWVMQKIADLKASGTELNEIAIIYTKHRIVENLVRYCIQKGIPVNVKKRVNVLKEKEVAQLITILSYLNQEFTKPFSAEDQLFEILHYACFGLSALDIAAVTVFCRRKQGEEDFLQWRPVLSNTAMLTRAGVRNPEKIHAVASMLEGWLADIPNVTIQTLIEKIISDSGMLSLWLCSEDKAWKLQLVNTFFDFVKEEAAKAGDLSLKEVMYLLGMMDENDLELPVSRIINSQNGIHFLTAHGAKGLEFNHVFIIRANSNQWEKKQGANGAYPLLPTLSSSMHAASIEDDRRLMYVAMTRAKNYLYITWPIASDSEKSLEPSRFITEITHLENKKTEKVSPEVVTEYKAEVMKYNQGTLSLIDHDLVDRLLENFKMSATSLNKFLRCRLAFYFENLLRVPMGRSASMGFGNAIHYALEHYFQDFENAVPRSLPSVARLSDYYVKGLDKYRSHFTAQEYDNHLKHGMNVLAEYYDQYNQEWWAARKHEPEIDIPMTEFKGIPISGKLDRVNIFDDHVSVTDYKTGKYDSKKLKEPTGEEDNGGDYWRQIIFYRLLLDGDRKHNWVMKKGIMDFVEKNKDGKFQRKEFSIESFEIEKVGEQLQSTYAAILAHEFTPGCGDADCQWCNFVNWNMPVSVQEAEAEER